MTTTLIGMKNKVSKTPLWKKMSKYLKTHCFPCVIAHHVFCTCGSWPYGLVPWKRKLPNILKTFEIQYNVTHIYSCFLYYGAWNCVKYMTQRNPPPPPPEIRKDTISWKHLISSTLNKNILNLLLVSLCIKSSNDI